MNTCYSIQPFSIHIPDEAVCSLQERLRNTRWAPAIESSNWEDGTDAAYLQSLVNYWANEYNWRERERELNRFDHFVADIAGTAIHFIHAKSKAANAIPLLLLHGWPGSFIQVLPVIPLLTEQRNDGTPAFHVVAASLPGYPFSAMPARHGMSFSRIADLMTQLMVDLLGYTRFAARGSDQGALVQQQMGLKYPDHLMGIHRTGITPFLHPLPADLTEAELAYQQNVASWAKRETAYASLQSLRPETLVTALADSPAGLAGWLIEKFQRWGDCRGTVDAHFGRDRLLDNLSLHWFTGAGAASIRLYHEAMRDPGLSGRVELPTAIMMPLRDGITVPAPQEWAERFYNLQRWTVLEEGGHFSEWEIPVQTANDIRAFFKTIWVEKAAGTDASGPA